MPIYEYRCQSCEETVEKLQRMNDAPLTDCPACGESALKRLVSASSFRLKGGGWYETDFKKDNKRNRADSSDGEGKSDSKKDGDKADSKKDSKKDSSTSGSGKDSKTTDSSSKKTNKSSGEKPST